MANKTPIASLRRQILKHRGIAVQPKTKRFIPVEDLPDAYPKTPKMKYIETKYHIKLEAVIYNGSLTDVCIRFNWEVDRSTISRWRKYIGIFIGRRR